MDVDVTSATVRALGFIAQFQAAGSAYFLFLFTRGQSQPAVVRLARSSALLAIVLVLAHQLLNAARMSGEFSGIFDASLQLLALRSSTAVANALRTAGLLLIVAGLRRVARTPLAVAGGLLVCAAFLLVGHTSTHALRWALAPLLLLHLLVVSGWFGSLLPLCMAVRQQPAPLSAALLERFSILAVRLVPSILLAGAGIAIVLLPGVAALRHSYGQLLLAKVAGFALLMLLAALNKWRLTPALSRGDGGAARALVRSMAVEWLIIAAVLCITATLTTFYAPEA